MCEYRRARTPHGFPSEGGWLLLDTNVLIYASEPLGDYRDWSRETIATAVAGEGAAINVVTLAELCVGNREPHTLADRIRSWGVGVLDLPVALAPVCALAYVDDLRHRKATAAKRIGRVTLPDFFIGAHAQIMGWALATADEGRFRTYFPEVELLTPRAGRGPHCS